MRSRVPAAIARRATTVTSPRATRSLTSFCPLPNRRLSSRPSSSSPRPPFRTYAATADLTPASSTPPPPATRTEVLSTLPDNIPLPGSTGLYSVLKDLHQLLVSDFGGSDEWLKRVGRAQVDLESTRRGRIGFYGDALSGPRDVVSALLQNPLADTDISRHALLTRHVDSNTPVLTITRGDVPKRFTDTLQVPSTWLQTSNYNVQEINKDLNDTELVDSLLESDISVLVVDPYRLLSSVADIIPPLAARGNLYIVVNGQLPPSTSKDEIQTHLDKQFQGLVPEGAEKPQAVFVQAGLALLAQNVLWEGLTLEVPPAARAVAVEVFQQDFILSNVTALQNELLTRTSLLMQPQDESAANLARLAINHAESVVAADREGIHSAALVVDKLTKAANRAATHAKHSSVANRGIEGGVVAESVTHSLQQTSDGINKLFKDRWSWLSLVGKARADEIGAELSSFLEARFGKDLERQLVFETGQLSQLQDSLSAETDNILKGLTEDKSKQSHPLSSPVLLNHLSTLSLSIPPLEAGSLLLPIEQRRQQLIRESVPRLQLYAQQSLLSTLGLAASGVAGSWLLYVPPWGVLSAATAGGLGILSILASLALGQRFWGRAQRKFWEDWKRITQMLRGDLQTVVDDAVDTRLSAKPKAAAEGLQVIFKKRQRRLDQVEEKLQSLRSRI